MNGFKIATAVAAGYLSYHIISTPQGRQLAKNAIAALMDKSGLLGMVTRQMADGISRVANRPVYGENNEKPKEAQNEALQENA